ncbi:hypothetical protein B0T25DRAFT_156988 [Lasiosphaeria hispida]|uniref:Protein FAF1 n=1 Tax=Lasiosphaeria hispida TaxID=260671 RepID=A0AAJ0HM58_9PEZI|nr:hypothetical protein B0T25DRAFT_156988 [Lasiosphaeria hispida]
MPSTLGKRKSRPAEEETSADDQAAAYEALRRNFEARFKPLEVDGPARFEEDDEEYDGSTISEPSESEWGGLSGEEDDETPKVEVVDYTVPLPSASTMSKRELKAYLSSKPPPLSIDVPTTKSKSTDPAREAPEDSAAFLANDLALQRLIAESHILSAAGGNASHYLSEAAAANGANSRPFAEGRTRLRTTDMRIQALGAKGSALAQAKMPMSMRKGILQSAETREDKRRREARENGIVLEREPSSGSSGGPAAKKKKKKKRSDERPVDMPSVGKMRGAELRISAFEARSIASEGSRRGGRGGGRGGRKRR